MRKPGRLAHHTGLTAVAATPVQAADTMSPTAPWSSKRARSGWTRRFQNRRPIPTSATRICRP